MPSDERLVATFLASLPRPPTAVDRVTLTNALQSLIRRARAGVPTVDVEASAFVKHAAERVDAESPIAALEQLRADDLYLACGCMRGDAAALAALEERHLAQLEAQLAASRSIAPYAREACQVLRLRLLVASDGQPPRIGSYRGIGSLASWLRMTVTRIAFELREAGGRLDGPAALDDEPAPVTDDPELLMLQRRYGDAVQRALSDAFAAVEPRERTVLRMFFLDAVPAAEIGRLFEVSGRTVQRWIAETRARVAARARTLLAARVGASETEVRTIMRLLESQLLVSVKRLLETPRP